MIVYIVSLPFRSTQILMKSGKKSKMKQKEFLAITRYGRRNYMRWWCNFESYMYITILHYGVSTFFSFLLSTRTYKGF